MNGSVMKILFATAEVTPFSKVGGLADVAGALPKALESLGAEVKIITPGYDSISWEKYDIEPVGEYKVQVGEEEYSAEIVKTALPGSEDIEVFLVRNSHYFDRKGIYTIPASGEGYPDNDERYIFFMRAILKWLQEEEWIPDIIHCNDHHTGLLPAYLREFYSNDPKLGGIRTVYTIHNMGYQGISEPDALVKAGFPKDYAKTNEAFQFYGKFNFMKVALYYADKINTVSPTYAQEIMSSNEFGFGLEDDLRKRESDVSGILNGVDYSEWSPEKDDLIAHNYDMKNITGKAKNREELLRMNRLVAPRSTPVIGIVSRLVDQKGFDILWDAMEDLLQEDLRLIILGTGDNRYHRLLEEIKQDYPEKFAINLAYDNRMAHMIEAGSDMFLMPSKYEPCGLNQMYSLKYGTIPIVHATGGLADTIDDYDPETHQGNGFSFTNYSSEALLKTIRRGLRTFRNKAQWKFLRDNAMRCDFSWEVSAKKYLELYEEAMKK